MSKRNGIVLAAAIFGVAVILFLIIANFSGTYDVGMSAHGWVAMIGSSVLALLLGGALTTLLVVSRRRGYDERAQNVFENPDQGDQSD